uniref:Fibronectin type-III domain-containing protein n=2 Tax=Amphimedon queenslandica TaxID=400682 RepID=A0A1X7TRN0_AMPQE
MHTTPTFCLLLNLISMFKLQVVAFLLSVSEVISQCPPSSGIYLRLQNGNCYPNRSFIADTIIRSTPLECVLPDATLNDGQWIGPNGAVPCDGGSNSNAQCTTGTGPSANLSVFINPPNYLGAPGDGWYKCCLPTNCSDPNTNIIFANIFRFAQIDSFAVADLPFDMTVYPQEYKLDCTKIGFEFSYDIRIGIDNTALASYTGCIDDSDTCPGTVIDSSIYKIRYTVSITWDGMTVSSGSVSQSTTGDQMYQCVVAVTNQPTRIRNMTIKAPAIAPSSLTEVNKTATTITVSWTALDSSNADGYVVNVTSDTDTVQTVQVEGSSNNTIILNGLRELTTYNITVRAYQQLLGPASTISVFTHCQQGGIYLKHNGNCHQNGSYFWDNTVNAVTEAMSCVLPGASLTTGQWVRVADPDDPVDCNSNNASDPFRCTSVTLPDATLNLYLAQLISATTEGWYKCCLPTDCSNSNTNIIFANIFRYAEIESFTVASLPSDMTVYPQEYELGCTKIGHSLYSISMSIGSTTLASYTNCDDQLNDCPGTVLFYEYQYVSLYRISIWSSWSVSSIMDTTWAVISWSVPSYIPPDYPIITYEIGYHILFNRLCCSMVNDNDIDIHMSHLYNSTSDSTFINITGLNDKSCYIFGVRAYTDRGPGNWRVIANETLISTQFVTLTLVHVLTSTSTSTSTQEVCIGSTNTASEFVDNISIGLVAVVGLLLISLVISIIIHIYCLIKLKSYYTVANKETNKFSVDAIPMQACEPYGIHKAKEITREAVYEDINVDEAIYET